jgi:HAD superfamily hydrolase (TIGR01509 family)
VSIRGLVFDFGGVLVRMIDDRPRIALANKIGISLSRLDELVFLSETAAKASKGEISVTMHWDAVRKALGLQPEDMPDFLQQYWSADDVNWRLLDFIRGLRPRYKVGLLSNAWDDLRKTLHERWNIDGLFDELVISAEVKLVKPDPRIFQLALKRLNILPAETIFIDDINENVQSARQIGLKGILYQSFDQTIGEIKDYLAAG